MVTPTRTDRALLWARIGVLAAAVVAHLLLVDPNPATALVPTAILAWFVLPPMGRSDQPPAPDVRRWLVLGAVVLGLLVGSMLLLYALPDGADSPIALVGPVVVATVLVVEFGCGLGYVVRAQLRGTPTGDVRRDPPIDRSGRHPVVAALGAISREEARRFFAPQVVAGALVWSAVEFVDVAPDALVVAGVVVAVLFPPLVVWWLTRPDPA